MFENWFFEMIKMDSWKQNIKHFTDDTVIIFAHCKEASERQTRNWLYCRN